MTEIKYTKCGICGKRTSMDVAEKIIFKELTGSAETIYVACPSCAREIRMDISLLARNSRIGREYESFKNGYTDIDCCDGYNVSDEL